MSNLLLLLFLLPVFLFLTGRFLLGDLPEVRPDIFQGPVGHARFGHALLRAWYYCSHGHDPQDHVKVTTVAAVNAFYGIETISTRHSSLARHSSSEDSITLGDDASLVAASSASGSLGTTPSASPVIVPAPFSESAVQAIATPVIATATAIPWHLDISEAMANPPMLGTPLPQLPGQSDKEYDQEMRDRKTWKYLLHIEWIVHAGNSVPFGCLADDEDDDPYYMVEGMAIHALVPTAKPRSWGHLSGHPKVEEGDDW